MGLGFPEQPVLVQATGLLIPVLDRYSFRLPVCGQPGTSQAVSKAGEISPGLLTARDVPERRLSSVLKVIWHVPPFRDVPGCQQSGGDFPRFADTSRLRFLQPIAREKKRKPETNNSCLSRGK